MTAPCSFPPGFTGSPGDVVQCDCPAAKGRFQVGQVGDAITCDIPPTSDLHYLWSAARTVIHGNPGSTMERG